MTGAVLEVVAQVTAVVTALVAARVDVRHLRIPNRLTGGAALVGLAVAALAAVERGGGVLVAALVGGAIGLVVLGVPWAFGLIGAGDVKLVAALGLLVRWPAALTLVLAVAVAGGVVALVLAVHARRLAAIGRNLIGAGDGRLHRMPYGLAIALGCAWTVVALHLPALRL